MVSNGEPVSLKTMGFSLILIEPGMVLIVMIRKKSSLRSGRGTSQANGGGIETMILQL